MFYILMLFGDKVGRAIMLKRETKQGFKYLGLILCSSDPMERKIEFFNLYKLEGQGLGDLE